MQDFTYRGWLVLIAESGHTDEILVGEGGKGGGEGGGEGKRMKEEKDEQIGVCQHVVNSSDWLLMTLQFHLPPSTQTRYMPLLPPPPPG